MAFRATCYWRAMVTEIGSSRRISTVAPKMKPAAATMDASHHKSKYLKGEFVPVYVVLGLVVCATAIAGHTAKQQLLHHPGVHFSKKKRETMAEVVDPDCAAKEADKFITKSFLRKVAHIQDPKKTPAVSDPTRPDPFHSPRHVETLKSVGVDPKKP